MISDQKGSAIIEMAIVLPIFLFLLIAIVDFGLYFNKRNVAQSAAYNAAKDCVPTPERASIEPTSTSSYGVTLETMGLLSSVNMNQPPFCNDQGGYYQVDIRIQGTMMSPFTSALGLYNSGQGFLVIGIASK